MKSIKRILRIILPLILVGITILALAKVQDISDWFTLRNYQPSDSIKSLSDNSLMSDYGRKLFYVSKPELLNKNDFNKNCSVGEETIVLGCYVNQKNIYIYDVNEPKLSGIEEVTASHEMLHVAYSRLSPKEKEKVNKLLEDAYSRLTNERLIKNVNSYKEKDPNVVDNELHSILGTEVGDLPKDLEEYYSKYFVDRTRVVELAVNYENEFIKLENQIKLYDEQLNQLNGAITRKEAELNETNNDLTSERQRIEAIDKTESVESYNKAVREFNKKVTNYNNQVDEVKNLIGNYNEIVTKRNEIAAQEVGLVEAIDTRINEL